MSAKPSRQFGHLTDQQELFAFGYVANGGNATDAARSAGFAHPHTAGARLLLKPHVSARIKQMVALDITSKLGQLVAVAWEIAMDPSKSAKDRLKAVEMLMDRGGLAVPRGQAAPSVAVQVNVATTAGEAQAAIREIWESRQARQKAVAMAGQGSGQAMIEHEDTQGLDNEG